jgi:hypothetical protein
LPRTRWARAIDSSPGRPGGGDLSRAQRKGRGGGFAATD